jgi:hypothetical protein
VAAVMAHSARDGPVRGGVPCEGEEERSCEGGASTVGGGRSGANFTSAEVMVGRGKDGDWQ